MPAVDFSTAYASIPLWPLATAILLGLFGRRLPDRVVSFIGVLGPFTAFLVAVHAFRDLAALPDTHFVPPHVIYDWLHIGQLYIPMAFAWDGLAATLTLVITGVGSLIHIYSTGYMAGDKGYARYFCYLNLFTAMMLILVLGENLPMMFIGWEGVGLCSYLLIGFWFEDSAKAAAGMKAFVVNRIGDAAFLMGMFLLFGAFGTLSFTGINEAVAGNAKLLTAGMATAITLLLFVGATGKSAQIPLFVWLPDAMAGPTPVSALIHAATMVTAGVYMIARLGTLFAAAPVTGAVIAIVGASTALFAATVALTQFDIKKVLAYSTVSQLGYMFVAMGVGAYTAGVFHLVTHAFFKALLFLGAGAVIHALGGEQDLRRMGGLARRFPLTFASMLIGALALAGMPPLAGFWSKDLILEHALEAGHGPLGPVAYLVYAMAALGVFLTAFYSLRMVAMTFLGSPAPADPDASDGHGSSQESGGRGAADALQSDRAAVAGHAHGSSLGMELALIVLLAASILGGGINLPAVGGTSGQHLHHFIASALPVPTPHAPSNVPAINLAISLALGIGGMLMGLVCYTKHRKAMESLFAEGDLASLAKASRGAWGVDRALTGASRMVSLATARMLLIVDQFGIDAAVGAVPRAVRLVGGELRRSQSGKLRGYLVLFGVAVLLVFAFLYRLLSVGGTV